MLDYFDVYFQFHGVIIPSQDGKLYLIIGGKQTYKRSDTALYMPLPDVEVLVPDWVGGKDVTLPPTRYSIPNLHTTQ